MPPSDHLGDPAVAVLVPPGFPGDFRLGGEGAVRVLVRLQFADDGQAGRKLHAGEAVLDEAADVRVVGS